MARHRTHEKSVRTRMLTVRLTPEDHQRLVEAAATGGTTVSGVAERLIVTGRINVAATEQLDPKVMAMTFGSSCSVAATLMRPVTIKRSATPETVVPPVAAASTRR